MLWNFSRNLLWNFFTYFEVCCCCFIDIAKHCDCCWLLCIYTHCGCGFVSCSLPQWVCKTLVPQVETGINVLVHLTKQWMGIKNDCGCITAKAYVNALPPWKYILRYSNTQIRFYEFHCTRSGYILLSEYMSNDPTKQTIFSITK